MATIEPNRLLQDELIFELQIRGISNPTGNVDELRKTVRDMLRVEKLGKSFKIHREGLEFDKELKICEGKLKDAMVGVEEFDGSENQWRKWSSRIAHLLGRIELLEPSGEEDTSSRSQLLQKAIKAFGNLTDKREEAKCKADAERLSRIDPVLTSTPLGSHAAGPLSNQSNLGTPGASGAYHTGEGHLLPNVPVLSGTVMPVHKWGIRFSGEVHKTSLNSFLEQVEDYRQSRGITKGQLYYAASELFEGKAKPWYRAIRKNVSSWDELVVELKREFQPVDYSERLWEEIKDRTQGPQESIGIYLANMSNLFSRLAIFVPEDTKIRILRRNILPYFQDQLALTDIHSEQELLEVCRKIDAHKSQVRSYQAPNPSTRTCLEPDLSYVGPKRLHAVNAVSGEVSGTLSECWNCRKPGHIAKHCRAPRRKHCFSCGTPDVVKSECPKCSKVFRSFKPSDRSGNISEVQSNRTDN